MTLLELKDKLRTAGLHVIHVEDDVEEDDSKGLTFCGTLEEYIESLGALDKKVIFIATMSLDEDNFEYSLRNKSYDDEGQLEIEEEEIDLCSINPVLERFKKEIGKVGVYKLFSSMSDESLNFYLREDWWLEFVDVCYEAIQDVNLGKIERLNKIEKAKKEKEKDLIKVIKQLSKDSAFCNLKTQRAMTAYVTENIDGADSLDPSILRKEVQALYDKVR